MAKLDRSAVADRLGLDGAYAAWLDSLDAVGAPRRRLSLPEGEQAEAVLHRLGLIDPDLAAVVAAIPSADRQPELWWLLERCHHQLVRSIGGGVVAPGGAPSLPPHLGVVGRCFWVYVFLSAVDDIERWHRQRGIPEDVTQATLADLGQHVARDRRRTGTIGFSSQFWIGLHFTGGLFALGRLQFTPYRLRSGPAGPLFWHEPATIQRLGPGHRPGDPALAVHIPAGGRLTPAACDQSFRKAAGFFPRHFPEQRYRVATCTSWLMDDQLTEYLPATSNIVRFQQRFELVPGALDDDGEIFKFVFERGPESIDDLSPGTALEHALIRHVRAGRHWRMRTGWLEI